MDVYKAPNYLTIQLKRFEESGGMSNKLENTITFPIRNFDLSNIVQNHELPHKCLENSGMKLVKIPFEE